MAFVSLQLFILSFSLINIISASESSSSGGITEAEALQRGRELMTQNRYRQALPLFTMAIRRNPSADNYEERAKCYEAMNKSREAIADYQEAQRLKSPYKRIER